MNNFNAKKFIYDTLSVLRAEVPTGMYLDSDDTWRMECGCTEANVLDNNHNVCQNSGHNNDDPSAIEGNSVRISV